MTSYISSVSLLTAIQKAFCSSVISKAESPLGTYSQIGLWLERGQSSVPWWVFCLGPTRGNPLLPSRTSLISILKPKSILQKIHIPGCKCSLCIPSLSSLCELQNLPWGSVRGPVVIGEMTPLHHPFISSSA